MNQELWKEWLEKIFDESEYVVVKNGKDKARNVYVCRDGAKKRLISIWPNKGMYNVIIQNEVKEVLDRKGFEYTVEAIVEGNRYDYRQVTEAHVLQLCRVYVEGAYMIQDLCD